MIFNLYKNDILKKQYNIFYSFYLNFFIKQKKKINIFK